MAKTKISEYDSTAANNTDIDGVNLAEGCPPSGINNAIRESMAHLKNFQTGASGDNLTVGGNLNLQGELQLNASAGTSGQFLTSQGSGSDPTWTTLTPFVSGMIMLWSGSEASIPSGWVLCDGTNSTPNLQDRFVVGAGNTYAVDATGGSADAVVVSHNHTATSSVSDPGHNHGMIGAGFPDTFNSTAYVPSRLSTSPFSSSNWSATTGISVSTSVASSGVSGTNKNLPPYYALCYIMKT
jgi:hypothetical protein